jgi:AraC family transcriptional regulator
MQANEAFMAYTIDILSLQTPEHLRNGLEHRSRFDCGSFEVSVFETFQSSTKVQISYDGLSISSMLRGSKVVYTSEGNSFRFVPGTSLILAEGETVYADFPDADHKKPVQCATILIPKNTLENLLLYFRKTYPQEYDIWTLDFKSFHFNNNSGIVRTMNDLLQVATETTPNYPLSDLLLKSLLVRTIHAHKEHVTDQHTLTMNTRLLLVKKYIKENIHQMINIETLMLVGNCSKSSLHRLFENYCGKSPGAYILQERMKNACNMLMQPDYNITDVAYQTGYSSVSYFVKQFKSYHHCTPGDFIRKYRQS